MARGGLFITGTDTGVGKTYVAAAITHRLRQQGLSVGVYKPAVSGSELGADGQPVWQDVEALWEASGRKFPRERICPQAFEAPLAPPTAARLENRVVDADLLRSGANWWRDRTDFLIVEGAGGLLSPLSDTGSVADLAVDLGFPLLIVARLGLGTINHTLLTVEAAESRGLRVAGVVLNEAIPKEGDPSTNQNEDDLTERLSLPVLMVIRNTPLSALLQDRSFLRIDWERLAHGAGR